MHNITWYKAKYGDEKILIEGRVLSIPKWLMALLLDKSGVRSKRRRVQVKAIRREFETLLIKSLAYAK